MYESMRGFAVLMLVAIAAPAWPADAVSRVIWADVVDAVPVRHEVRIPERQEVCWDEEVYREVPARRSATPKILGAIVGGVIGHQFGGGTGRDLLTGAGAVLGASVASDEQRRRHPDRYYATTEQRCEVRTAWRHEDRITAWDVTYAFDGELYQARMREAPGDRIRVRVGIQPLEP